MKELQSYIDKLQQKPDIKHCKKRMAKTKLSGYVTYTDTGERSTATMVRSNVAATQHMTAQGGCEHTLIEIHSRRVGGDRNIFILNAYCRPSNKNIDFEGPMIDCIKEAKTRPVIMVGDFTQPTRHGATNIRQKEETNRSKQ